MTNPSSRLNEYLDRLTRLHLSERRDGALNPAQIAALDYLSRANRFSRMPSAVAEYLSATRGTVSQTLKALARKGLITEHASPSDRRARRYDLTDVGHAALSSLPPLPDLPLSEAELTKAESALHGLLHAHLKARNMRSFGLCHSCRHHGREAGAPFCALLGLPLAPGEEAQICQDHEAA